MRFLRFAIYLLAACGIFYTCATHRAEAQTCGPPMAAGLYQGSITVNGTVRTYAYRIAANYAPCDAQQLLIGFHGTCQSANCGNNLDLKNVSQVYAQAPYNKKAIVVYPNALACQPNFPQCPQSSYGWDLAAGGPDEALFLALVSQFESVYVVDTAHVFVFGFSRGAYEGELIATRQAIAGMFSVAGALPGTTQPTVARVHGSRGCDNDNAVSISSMIATRDAWRSVNACTSTSSAFGRDATCVAYSCRNKQTTWCERASCSPPHTWAFPEDTQDLCDAFAGVQ